MNWLTITDPKILKSSKLSFAKTRKFVKDDQVFQKVQVEIYWIWFGNLREGYSAIQTSPTWKSQGSDLCWNTIRSEQPRRCHVRPPGEEVPQMVLPKRWKRWKCGTIWEKEWRLCEAFGFLGLFCAARGAGGPRPKKMPRDITYTYVPYKRQGKKMAPWSTDFGGSQESESGRWMDEDVTSFKRPHPMDMWILPQWPWFSMTIFRTDKNKVDQTEMDHDRTSHGSWVVGTLKSSNDTAQTLEKSWEVLLSC